MTNGHSLRPMPWIAVLVLFLGACGNDEAGGATEATGGAADAEAVDGESAAAEVIGPEVTLTLGHPFPAGHPIQVRAIEPLVEDVAEATNGTVTMTIVAGGALGAGPGVYENTVSGAQDAGWALQGYTPGRFPLTDVVELPFTFGSATEATDVLWSLYEEFPEFQAEYDDVHVLGLWTHDVGDLWTAGSDVSTMEDTQGLTLRAPGPLQSRLIEELGGSSVSLPAPELYDSLERGVIDGLMIPASALESFGLFEVVDRGVACDCYVAAHFLAVNQTSWDQLSDEQQAAIDEVAGRTFSLRAAEVYDEEYEQVQASLADEGIEVVELDDAELDRWRQAGQVVVDGWIADREAEGAPGQEMYDRLTELVAN